jgi:hypothetical protein
MDRRAILRRLDAAVLELAALRALLKAADEPDEPADPRAEAVERLRRCCAERGIEVGLGDTIAEGDAARLLRRSASSLRRWRAEGRGPNWRRGLGQRVEYALADITEFHAVNTGGGD